MNIKEIVSLVLYILAVLGYAIIAVCALIKKIKHKNSATTDSGVDYNKVLDTCCSALEEMFHVENLYNSVFKDGIKAGPFKQRDVLSALKELCSNIGLPFDEDKWKKYIEYVVNFQNSTKSNLHHVEGLEGTTFSIKEENK